MDRIDKILSRHGFGSRKDVKHLLRKGNVCVNGTVIYDPSFQIDIECDKVTVDEKPVVLQSQIYIMMNKCSGTVCSTKDKNHSTVFDLLDETLLGKLPGGELHTVGRLDVDTEGLLLFTTDGKLTHTLLSPKTHVPKTYAVALENKLSDEEKDEYKKKFSEGFFVIREGNETGFDALPAKLEWLEKSSINDESNNESKIEGENKRFDCLLTISEGKYHQVKRMFRTLGNEVILLKRISMGILTLDETLAPGEYRPLTEDEILLISGIKK